MSLEAVVLQRLQSKRNAIHISNEEEGEDNTYTPVFHCGFPHKTIHLSSASASSNVISTSSSCRTPVELPVVECCTRKRKKRRRGVSKEVNVEEKRKKHIEVERKRRKEMNSQFSLLRSLMPPSYSFRGEQASIVGGAIILVKELEQHLQYLQSQQHYSRQSASSEEPPAEVEVRVAERHATVKVLTRKQPKQLLRVLLELASAHLTVLHLNVTSIDSFVLYSFSLKKEDECKLNTVNEIATAVYNMIKRIRQHPELGI